MIRYLFVLCLMIFSTHATSVEKLADTAPQKTSQYTVAQIKQIVQWCNEINAKIDMSPNHYVYDEATGELSNGLVKFRFEELNVTTPFEVMEKVYKQYHTVVLRLFSRDTKKVLGGCGNTPLSADAGQKASEEYRSEHHHEEYVTADIDLGKNPNMVGSVGGSGGVLPYLIDTLGRHHLEVFAIEGFGPHEEGKKKFFTPLLEILSPNGFIQLLRVNPFSDSLIPVNQMSEFLKYDDVTFYLYQQLAKTIPEAFERNVKKLGGLDQLLQQIQRVVEAACLREQNGRRFSISSEILGSEDVEKILKDLTNHFQSPLLEVSLTDYLILQGETREELEQTLEGFDAFLKRKAIREEDLHLTQSEAREIAIDGWLNSESRYEARFPDAAPLVASLPVGATGSS